MIHLREHPDYISSYTVIGGEGCLDGRCPHEHHLIITNNVISRAIPSWNPIGCNIDCFHRLIGVIGGNIHPEQVWTIHTGVHHKHC